MEELKKKTNWVQLIGIVLIIFLGVEDVLLILQNKQLKATINTLTTPQMEPLKTGDRLEPVKIQSFDGSRSDLIYSDSTKKYLLFLFSTTCPHCEKNIPIWQSLIASMDNHIKILGVSTQKLNETKQFIQGKIVNFRIVTAYEDTSFQRKYRVIGVPETILIDGEGKVEKVWMGELQPDQINEIKILTTIPVSPN
jgi:cytochrome c biogenesis protein CcmG, thiol:disulfide interchange protein DsbE